MRSAFSYRRDIDGLRALAILPLVLYHTHVPGFGGYVGVDMQRYHVKFARLVAPLPG